jgi:hypothetical protein
MLVIAVGVESTRGRIAAALDAGLNFYPWFLSNLLCMHVCMYQSIYLSIYVDVFEEVVVVYYLRFAHLLL